MHLLTTLLSTHICKLVLFLTLHHSHQLHRNTTGHRCCCVQFKKGLSVIIVVIPCMLIQMFSLLWCALTCANVVSQCDSNSTTFAHFYASL